MSKLKCRSNDGDPVYIDFTIANQTLPGTEADTILKLSMRRDNLDFEEYNIPLFWVNVTNGVIIDTNLECVVNAPPSCQSMMTRGQVRKVTEFEYYLLVIIEETPIQEQYIIKISKKSKYMFEYDGVKYRVVSGVDQIVYSNSLSKSQMENSNKAGSVAGTMMIGFGNSSTSTNSVKMLFFALSLDPTGTALKFTQSIGVMSKLLYLNAYYGPSLKRFLETSDRTANTVKEPTFKVVEMRSNGYKRKLSHYRLLVSGDNKLRPQSIVYLISWTLNLFLLFARKKNIRAGKTGMVIMGFFPKLHFMVMNSFLIDFSFYLSRTYLHSKHLGSKVISLSIMMLLSIDVILVFNKALDSKAWRTIFRLKTLQRVQLETMKSANKKMNEKKEYTQEDFNKELQMNYEKAFSKNALQKRAENESVTDPKLKEETSSQSEINSSSSKQLMIRKKIFNGHRNKQRLNSGAKTKEEPQKLSNVINYKKSYELIYQNMHLTEVMANPLVVSDRVFSNKVCRSTFAMHILRIFTYHLLIVSTQYASVLAFTVLVGMEMSKVLLISITYYKHRHYRYKVLYLLDVSQSIFMFIFLWLCFPSISRKSPTKISESQETIAMWCIILSCGMENILNFIYIMTSSIVGIKNWCNTKDSKKFLEKADEKFKIQTVFTFSQREISLMALSDQQELMRDKERMELEDNFDFPRNQKVGASEEIEGQSSRLDINVDLEKERKHGLSPQIKDMDCSRETLKEDKLEERESVVFAENVREDIFGRQEKVVQNGRIISHVMRKNEREGEIDVYVPRNKIRQKAMNRLGTSSVGPMVPTSIISMSGVYTGGGETRTDKQVSGITKIDAKDSKINMVVTENESRLSKRNPRYTSKYDHLKKYFESIK